MKLSNIRKILIVFFTFVIFGCANTSKVNSLYLGKYVVLEKHSPTEVSIGSEIIEFDKLDTKKILELSSKYSSHNFLLGLKTEFIIMDIFKLGPIISKTKGKLFMLNAEGEIKSLTYVD